MSLIHYIIVRRDLPLGTLAAMITHAAGESGYLYSDGIGGVFTGATAVVLEVKSELLLYRAATLLRNFNCRHVEIVENSGVYEGQLMALGLVPIDRAEIGNLLEKFQTLKKLDEPETLNIGYIAVAEGGFLPVDPRLQT